MSDHAWDCAPKPFPRVTLDPFHPEDLEWSRYRSQLKYWLDLGHVPASWSNPLHDIVADIRRVQRDWRIQLTHGRKGPYWEIIRLTQDEDMS